MQIVDATIRHTVFWRHIIIFRLSINTGLVADANRTIQSDRLHAKKSRHGFYKLDEGRANDLDDDSVSTN